MVVVVVVVVVADSLHNEHRPERTLVVDSAGSFFLACDDCGRIFDHSFHACGFFVVVFCVCVFFLFCFFVVVFFWGEESGRGGGSRD